jgi:CheY-like chemotaxis protein
VNDEKLIVDMMVEILNAAGFEAIGAYDGSAALEQIAHRQPDYLLSDVLMPQMNGVELAIAIRKMYPCDPDRALRRTGRNFGDTAWGTEARLPLRIACQADSSTKVN